MFIKKLLLFAILLVSININAQKKAITHAEYDGWKSIRNPQISNNGNWVNYEINPQEGDGWIYFFNVKTNALDSTARGYNASFSPASDFIFYRIKPTFAETRKAKKDKKKRDQMPKNALGFRNLSSGEEIIIDDVKSYKIAEEGSWLAYLMEKTKEKAKEKKEKPGESKAEEEKANEEPEAPVEKKPKKKAPKKPTQKGTDFIIKNPGGEAEFKFENVTDYEISKNGSTISYVQTITDTAKLDHISVSIFNTEKEENKEIFAAIGDLKNLTVNNQGDKIGFLFSADTTKVKVYDLYLSNGEASEMIVNAATNGMTEGWAVSENGNLSFSENGERLFFGTALKPVEEPKDTLLKEEKYSLDIWSWDDPYLQPQQKVQLKNEEKRTYQAVYLCNSKKMVQLANPEMPNIRFLQKKDGKLALGSSNLKYRKETSWDSNRYSDYYLVDVETGKAKLIKEKAPSTVQLSPNGKYMIFWCIKCKSWYVQPTSGGDAINLTKALGVPFHNELHDSPSEPRTHGIAGWIKGERYIVIYDRYDIWKIDVTGKEKAINLTNSFGRKNNIQFRYFSLDPENGGMGGRYYGSREIQEIGAKELMHLSAFNYYTKQSGIYTVKANQVKDPIKVDMGDYSYTSFKKAKDNDQIIFQRGNFENYPEIYVSDLKLKNIEKVSVTNPQQKEYNWGSVELVEWRSFDGQMLQGLLYKPENFDPNKKYPMIAYFYERSSDGLHRYMPPAPSASTINRTYAVSNEYIIFVPDIPYKIGYPGQSAYNAVVSGTYAMLDQFDFIDPDRLGLDGQSWGGYQIAYLITQTDLYKCAFSGAPVSNMTSAYGGIRWGSGMNRAFQYEKTQSRIGGTLWEKPIHYIENSPLFFVPKINTPVLIMHNDADGAVPWYQGIEFINALRRLSKPAWMLSYNDEAHNLRRRPNRKDLSVRKMQFFDYYLQGKPIPYWMKHGISQMEKGKKDGYELIEE